MAESYQDLGKASDVYSQDSTFYGASTPVGAALGGTQRRDTEKTLIESPLQNELRRRRDVLQRQINDAQSKLYGIDYLLNLFRD